MPTPIITLPIHTIEQARALAGLLRAYIDGQSPDTNDGQDWKPDPDLAGVAALYAHLDAGRSQDCSGGRVMLHERLNAAASNPLYSAIAALLLEAAKATTPDDGPLQAKRDAFLRRILQSSVDAYPDDAMDKDMERVPLKVETLYPFYDFWRVEDESIDNEYGGAPVGHGYGRWLARAIGGLLPGDFKVIGGAGAKIGKTHFLGQMIEGRIMFANAGSALRAPTPEDPRRFPCPTCGEDDCLTLEDKRRGYQCDVCADRAEGRGGYE
jgi:hypothetical protein